MSQDDLITQKVHVTAEISENEKQFRVTLVSEEKLKPGQVQMILLGLSEQVEAVYLAQGLNPRAIEKVAERVAKATSQAVCEHGMPSAGPCLVCHPLPFGGHSA